MKYIERDAGKVVGLTKWSRFENQERLSDDDPEVIAYRTGNARWLAIEEVKGAAQRKAADLESTVTEDQARSKLAQFKTDFQAAATEEEVADLKALALAAIEAL